MLPSEGQSWQSLRRGEAEALSGRPPALCQIIATCMSPDIVRRPSAEQIQKSPLVYAAALEPDPTLAAAKIRAPPPKHGTALGLGRSTSIMFSHETPPTLFTEFPETDESGGDSARADLARNRVSTPTNFMGAHLFWQWAPAPTPFTASTTTKCTMETSPLVNGYEESNLQ